MTSRWQFKMAEERAVRWRRARRVRLNSAAYLFPLAFVSRVPVGAGGSRWITFFGESGGPCARNVTITGQHNNRSRPVSENLYTHCVARFRIFRKRKKRWVCHTNTLPWDFLRMTARPNKHKESIFQCVYRARTTLGDFLFRHFYYVRSSVRWKNAMARIENAQRS